MVRSTFAVQTCASPHYCITYQSWWFDKSHNLIRRARTRYATYQEMTVDLCLCLCLVIQCLCWLCRIVTFKIWKTSVIIHFVSCRAETNWPNIRLFVRWVKANEYSQLSRTFELTPYMYIMYGTIRTVDQCLTKKPGPSHAQRSMHTSQLATCPERGRDRVDLHDQRSSSTCTLQFTRTLHCRRSCVVGVVHFCTASAVRYMSSP